VANNSQTSGNSGRRIWAGAALILAAQLLLVFWLSDPGPSRARAVAASPSLESVPEQLIRDLAVTDPSLFALPQAHGFSGLSWLKFPMRSVPAFDWTESPRYLALSESSVGAFLARFLETNNPTPFFSLPKTEPVPALPAITPAVQALARSRLVVEGALARRRMLNHPELPSWPMNDQADFLTNSVVQITVDSHGFPLSLVLLRPGSGNGEADQSALALARQIRFEPDPAQTVLMWGELIFEWQMLPIK